MDGINYHGDERRRDQGHLYACHAIMEAPLSCRETSLSTLWLLEIARANDIRLCVLIFFFFFKHVSQTNGCMCMCVCNLEHDVVGDF